MNPLPCMCVFVTCFSILCAKKKFLLFLKAISGITSSRKAFVTTATLFSHPLDLGIHLFLQSPDLEHISVVPALILYFSICLWDSLPQVDHEISNAEAVILFISPSSALNPKLGTWLLHQEFWLASIGGKAFFITTDFVPFLQQPGIREIIISPMFRMRHLRLREVKGISRSQPVNE